LRRGKTGTLGEKPLGARREPTTNTPVSTQITEICKRAKQGKIEEVHFQLINQFLLP